MLPPKAGATAAVAADTAAVVVDTSVVDTSAVDTSAVDTLWPPHMLGSDQDLVYALHRGIAPVYSSRVDTAAISGMAVGGTTALARAGGGRTSTASTFGCATRAAEAQRRAQRVYVWADGIYLQARLEDEKQCILVSIGATPEGHKELVVVVVAMVVATRLPGGTNLFDQSMSQGTMTESAKQ
jgi:hypothetical protein